MDSLLPTTGSAAARLRTLSPYTPDEFINSLWPPHMRRGRRRVFSPAQLWRVHLLALLTPVHWFNLLVAMLPEQRAWRRFAHLRNRQALLDTWMLHEFTPLRLLLDELLPHQLPLDFHE